MTNRISSVPRILGVGIATLDIINTVDAYPAEDAEVRALSQRSCRGGNCTNTLVILSQLGHHCTWAGTLADDPDTAHISADLAAHHIDVSPVRRHAQGKVPTSYITLNRRNGSRTIVHYRDLPEYSFDDFRRIELSAFDWLHFEGRNVPATLRMLEHARKTAPSLRRSVEIEKKRDGIETLFPLADTLMFARSYAEACGYRDPGKLLAAAQNLAPHADLILAWGEQGAYGKPAHGEVLHSPALPPARIVDTLGAGDTFNAGIIDGSLRGYAMAQLLEHACRLAGSKCGKPGMSI